MPCISVPFCGAHVHGQKCGKQEGISAVETLKNAATKVVGTKQVLRGLKAAELSRIYVANDIDTFLFQKLIRAAEGAGVQVVRVDSSLELGRACGLESASAAAGIVR